MVFRFLHCLDLGNYGVHLGKKFISVIACVLYFQYNFIFSLHSTYCETILTYVF